ncbi:MAG: glycosyltransferase [Microbacterium sp.]
MSASHPHVVIAIPTFRRLERLGHLLGALPDQRFAAESLGVSTAVVVIDNDPAESARVVVARAEASYSTEPERGLSAVRNAAIAAAGDADALVFIDDDELPEPGWLAELVRVWLSGAADFVSGRVVSVFGQTLDPWIQAGGFFRRVEFSDGERMPFAATNNLLIDLSFLRMHRLTFDPKFGMSGGEDIRLTSQAVAAGARIVAAPSAVVLDPVPPERTTRGWVLRRAFRVGSTTVRCDVALAPTAFGRLIARIRWFANGVGRIVVGGLRWVTGSIARSTVHRARGARLIARGAGMCVGAFGVEYKEYRGRHAQ